MDLNKVLICGRATANPELRRTPGGISVTSFSIATNRVYKDKNDTRQEEVEYHNIVAWGRTADVASQFVTKGALVLVEGRLRTRAWQDRDGGNRKTTEIICERLQLGPRNTNNNVVKDDRSLKPGYMNQSTSNSDAPNPNPSENQTSALDLPVINLDAEPMQDGADEIPF